MSVPKLRFKEFTPEYNEYELKTLLKSYRLGGNYSNSESKTNYPLIKMGNLNRGSINLSKIEYIPEDELIDSQDIIQFGDLFFNTRNTLDLVGKVAIWRNELSIAYYNSNLLKLEFENNFYMNFLLNTEKSLEKLKAIASGTTSVAAIYTKDLLKVKVKIPFVDEQTKIASFLSNVDEKISQLTQKHALLSQYKQGMMQKLFSQEIRFKADDGGEFGEWEDAKLGSICQNFQSGKSITSAEISEDGDYPVYGGNGLRGYTNTFNHEGKYALIGRQGALCGNVVLVEGKNFVSEHAIAVQTKEKHSTDWLFRWLDYMQLNRFSESSAQAGLAVNKLVKFDIQTPCLEEQTKIANFLSAIDQKIEVVAQQIEQAKQWKKGLLQQMFV